MGVRQPRFLQNLSGVEIRRVLWVPGFKVVGIVEAKIDACVLSLFFCLSPFFSSDSSESRKKCCGTWKHDWIKLEKSHIPTVANEGLVWDSLLKNGGFWHPGWG